MHINTHVAPRAEQRLALTPKMLQSIELLQLSAVELVARVELELATNELLEAETPPEPALPGPSEDSFDADAFRARAPSGERDPKHEMLQNLPGRARGLREHLGDQLAWRDLDSELRALVERAIDALDDRGLLPLADDELAALVGASRLGEVLEVLHSLEPRGVGARTPVEAMLLQVPRTDPDRDRVEAVLREHLDDLYKNRLPAVARAIGASVEELGRLIERIGELEPRPGGRFSEHSETAIRPDLIAERDGEEFRVVVDDVSMPVLRVREDLAGLAASRDVPRPVRQHVGERLRAARDLVSAVAMRRDTLARVGAALLSHQRAFLERGRGAIRPLKMETIARELGLHNSTISRAIAGKHMQTEHGVFALRELFDGARASNPCDGPADGTGKSAILHRIRALIADENQRAPLSDEEIVARLRSSGVSISRRTVANYRRELGIRASWQRRTHGIR